MSLGMTGRKNRIIILLKTWRKKTVRQMVLLCEFQQTNYFLKELVTASVSEYNFYELCFPSMAKKDFSELQTAKWTFLMTKNFSHQSSYRLTSTSVISWFRQTIFFGSLWIIKIVFRNQKNRSKFVFKGRNYQFSSLFTITVGLNKIKVRPLVSHSENCFLFIMNYCCGFMV